MLRSAEHAILRIDAGAAERQVLGRNQLIDVLDQVAGCNADLVHGRARRAAGKIGPVFFPDDVIVRGIGEGMEIKARAAHLAHQGNDCRAVYSAG